MFIERYVAPTIFDKAPQGSAWSVIDQDQYFVQISPTEEKPNWITMGIFLETVFSESFKDSVFVEECMEVFFYHEKQKDNSKQIES